MKKYKSVILLWKYIIKDKKYKFKFIILFLLMILSIFADIVSIGAIIPFLGALTNPDILLQKEWFKIFVEIFKINSENDLIFKITILFILVALSASLIKLLLLYFNSKISAELGIELKSKIFEKTLCQSYEYHISHNSSELISLVTEKINRVIQSGILHVLMFFTSFFSALAIIFTLICINTIVAIIAFFVLGGGYILIGYLVRKKILKNGEVIKSNQPKAVKLLQEGLGGIRDIIIDNNQLIFISNYKKIASKIEYANMNNMLLSSMPKSIMEGLGITLIAALAYYLKVIEGNEQVLPILGALALGAQKLLPILQQMFTSWSFINAGLPLIEEVIEHLNLNQTVCFDNKEDKLSFKKDIKLKNISFSYDSKKLVLDNINLIIKKGQKVGFIGKTGSGKSTLIDIIMGLLKPKSGEIFIDDVLLDDYKIKLWQKNIAHVPQFIFLSDASIAENIAFGIPKEKIDMEKVIESAKKAALHDFIESLPNKYNTFVGERGVQLSGGQRQRIGIARALYKNAEVIVLDEATSALDNETEKSVMKSINKLNKNLTILMIAHRLSTLEECDVIYRLENGRIIETINDKKGLI
ncbi:ABC transporter ATP-binding protein [Caminibacter mediatlanticus]|uniref:ATPase n=1 Tax=Caminibacter mediatlanticus TB-2 TaxID=391592 RepID=A0AAI9AGC9_9BACT|nr:ABC transporter ATP-binding protein [Caminibacter mediatlanticus]EDM23168.1 ATPase [Caminibacter mediatlanticus TB-2]